MYHEVFKLFYFVEDIIYSKDKVLKKNYTTYFNNPSIAQWLKPRSKYLKVNHRESGKNKTNNPSIAQWLERLAVDYV